MRAPPRPPVWIGLLLPCCAAPRPVPGRGDWAFRIAHERDVDASFADAGRAILSGFPEAIEEDSFRVGDRLLYGFESFEGARVSRFYVQLETVPPGRAAAPRHELTLARRELERTVDTVLPRVRVRVFGHDLQPRATEVSEVVAALHEVGLFGYARLSDTRPLRREDLRLLECSRTLPPPELRDERLGWAVAMELFRELGTNAALADLLAGLSVWPTLLEQLALIGSRLALYDGLGHAMLVRQPIRALPAGDLAYETTIVLRRPSEPLLVVRAVLVPPVGPLAMSAGMVTISGYRGTDPTRRFVARLLALEQAAVTRAP